jgi:hypothetical protein
MTHLANEAAAATTVTAAASPCGLTSQHPISERGLSDATPVAPPGSTGYSNTVTYHSGSPKVTQSGYDDIVVKQG